jgi:uncharacterized protein YecE (DUF72 family)
MRIGTAGWNIPAAFQASFPEEGSHLIRYSQVLNAVEINSTFYKFHQAKTFERWALDTPADFQFSIKLHQSFTHDCDLKPKVRELNEFISGVHYLGPKWRVLLLQFPGKMIFHANKMNRFYELIRKKFDGHIVIEPRNETWLSKDSKKLLKDFKISKVIADPERCPSSLKTVTTAGGLVYYRLHGSPVIYRSSYSHAYLRRLKSELQGYKNAWCIFDNTTFGDATGNALELRG